MTVMQMSMDDEAVDRINRIADTFEVTASEVVRRGLALIQFWATLMPNQSLAIYNEDTGHVELVRCDWSQR